MLIFHNRYHYYYYYQLLRNYSGILSVYNKKKVFCFHIQYDKDVE